MSGSSEAQGVVGDAGGTGSASGPLSSVVESVPEESGGSTVARLSSDTLVQAEDLLRFRHQCIGSWDIRGSTLGRRNTQGGLKIQPWWVGTSLLPPCLRTLCSVRLQPHRPLASSSSIPTTLFLPTSLYSPTKVSPAPSLSPPPLPPAPMLCWRQCWALG